MAQHNSEQNVTLADKVASIISKNKIILWGILGVLIVLTIVFAVVDKNIKDKNIMYSNTSVELQDDFQEWFSALDEDKEEIEKNFLEKISGIVETEDVNILVEKALFLRGQFYIQKEEWDNAFGDFNRIAEISPESYLASVSLYNAASAKENGGDAESALEILTTINSEYKANSPVIPEVLFNMGRINETLNNNEAAIESYEELTTSYSSSNWTNLAKTRIISLKASGVSQ